VVLKGGGIYRFLSRKILDLQHQYNNCTTTPHKRVGPTHWSPPSCEELLCSSCDGVVQESNPFFLSPLYFSLFSPIFLFLLNFFFLFLRTSPQKLNFHLYLHLGPHASRCLALYCFFAPRRLILGFVKVYGFAFFKTRSIILC
jgi:hypothetical protein